MKKYIILAVFLIAIALGALAYAQSKSPLKVIKNTIASMNSQDWEKFIELQTAQSQSDYRAFFNNQQNKDNKEGAFNVSAAELYEIKELALEDVSAFTKTYEYESEYNQVKAFYAGIRFAVEKENAYYFNGVNYRLIIAVKEDGNWRVAEMSDAPIESFDSSMRFNSEPEAQALDNALS